MRSRMQVQNARAHVFYNRAFFRRSEYPTRSGLFSSTDPLVEWKITSPRHCPLSLRVAVRRRPDMDVCRRQSSLRATDWLRQWPPKHPCGVQ
jgi:hypothetical protein